MSKNKKSNNLGIDFSKAPYIYWDRSTKISYLQRKIIVYSIMYYEMNKSCISDMKYDALCKQLVHIQRSVDKEELKKSQYYYCMHDFDGTTGFDIYSRLKESDREYLSGIASFILSVQR